MIGDRRLAFTLAFLFATVAAAQDYDPETGDHLIARGHEGMGTYMHITIWGQDDDGAVKAIDDAFREIDRIDDEMTTWKEGSDVARINASAGDGKPVKVSDEVIEVVDKSLDMARLSNGLFDITVGSFSGVWKFDEDNDGTIPDDKLVQERKKLVDWHDVVVDHQAHTIMLKRKGQKITLGGIAKGYAVNKAVLVLRARGFADFIVQAGGDMYVAGKHGGRRWKVGIRDPRGPRDDFFAATEVEDATFSTSGDYERFTIKDGRRYHHIIDPTTGYPSMKCRSVTVMAKDAFESDAIDTTLFLMGPEKGIEAAKKEGVEAVFVDANNKIWVTPGLEGKLVMVHDPTDGI
jgi:thiamine biosynthesis lipoprotein